MVPRFKVASKSPEKRGIDLAIWIGSLVCYPLSFKSFRDHSNISYVVLASSLCLICHNRIRQTGVTNHCFSYSIITFLLRDYYILIPTF